MIRRSGLLVPLFSLVSTRSWGVGEFRDMPVFARWAASAGQSFIQILPVSEIPEAETSPYSALTAMALDPIYIALPDVDDFAALGGEAQLTATDRGLLDAVRAADRIPHGKVRSLKARCLRRAHDRFVREERPLSTARARRFDDFARDHASWLDDYALFQAVRGVQALKPWWEWPELLAQRDADALARVREDLAPEIDYRKYVQWIAAEQWAAARAASQPVAILGDVPFMISADSPDVWTRQREFRFDATVGVPPDAFSETGQDWGLPPWRWEVMAENGFEWMRARARRSAALFDGFRLDHLVGLYRTYMRPLDTSVPPFFAPPDEPSQVKLGERLVRLYQETGAEIIAEDLGVVPDFVRASLQRLGVPGFKVLRWERQWSSQDHPYIDPADYPEVSVATTGTHDTEPLAIWWDGLDRAEREKVLALPRVRQHLQEHGDAAIEAALNGFTTDLNDALLRELLSARSALAIVPMQDIFGWRDRINTPATVDDSNWTWRLPWPVDRLADLDEPRRRAEQLREWTAAASR